MSLSRKRRKELEKLRSSAEELWAHQQVVLDKANLVAREAGKQVGQLTREEVAPRVRDGYYQYVQPRFDATRDATRDFARGAGETFERTVVPVMGTALGSVLSVVDVAKDARIAAALRRAGYEAPAAKKAKSGPGFGTFLAVTAGVIAAAGVAYAVWQTFRADDELWIADEPLDIPAGDESAQND